MTPMKIFLMSSLLLLIVSCNFNSPADTGINKGAKIPQLRFLLVDSSIIDTASLVQNRPFVIVYFSPECIYCKAQIKDILESDRSLTDIQFYLVSSYSIEDVKAFGSEYNISKYSNIKIGVDKGGFINSYFKETKVPFIAIYGKDKTFREAYLGRTNVMQIKNVSGG